MMDEQNKKDVLGGNLESAIANNSRNRTWKTDSRADAGRAKTRLRKTYVEAGRFGMPDLQD
jgi:PAB1-binding protein PBP1